MSRAKTRFTIGLILMLSLIVAVMPSLSSVKAVDIKTFAYINVAPTPVGVGQEVIVSFWIDKLPPLDASNAGLTYSNFYVDVTDPDGNTKTMGPYQSDYIGAQYLKYTPDQVGTYQFQFRYLGETLESRIAFFQPLRNDTYLASTSHQFSLTVQQDPIPQYPGAPLPTEYWTRPIEGENREWYPLGGNWLGVPLQFGSGYDATGAFNPYTTAPNSPHIMWTKPHIFGGIVGGVFETRDFYTGLSYEAKWNPPTPVIINGRLYYHLPLSDHSTGGGLACVDLRTGEEYWTQDITINIGQLLQFDSPNQHGIIPYLWNRGSTYTMYDAVSGKEILTMENASTGNKVTFDEKGNMLVYQINSGQNWLRMWNSTRVSGLYNLAFTGQPDSYQWRPPVGGTLDWGTGIQWTTTIPSIPGQSLTLISDDILVTTKTYLDVDPVALQITGYDAHNGQYLWAFNITDYQMPQRAYYNFSPIHEGVFCWFDQVRMQWYGYDAYTGNKLWGPTEPYESAWGVYSQSYAGAGQPTFQCAYGNLYATAYDGTVHCFDMETGENLWNYFTGSSGYETQYGNYPFYGGPTIADGKVFISNNEHSPDSPNWRGGKLWAIDAYDGTLVWSILNWNIGPIIADGYLVGLNSYDGQIYCFGKGPSATSVSAGPRATYLGEKVVIDGTVTDISAGAKQDASAARFPNGLPAMSDEDMASWMEYVYMQKPLPTDATGVEVWIDVLDANGNYRNIGTTTSDINGYYSFTWKPDIPGDYKVIATFAGSESYWPSYSETSFTISEPEVTPAPSPTPAPMTDTYVLGLGSAAIVAIIVIGLVLIMMLRKR